MTPITGIVLDPVKVDDQFIVRLVNDRDGDVVQVTLPHATLAEALEEAREELMPYEFVVTTLDPEER